MSADHELAEEFERLRPRLFGAAYRILGVVADAEDTVQDVWLAWSRSDRSTVGDHTAYLLTATARTALNKKRAAQRRREDYLGPWLPEPLIVDDATSDVELADSVSMAMMVLLETLSPLERVAYVLHEVFALPYAEVGEALGRSEAAARQLGSRARAHVRERAPRQLVGRAEHRVSTQRFIEAANGGDLDALMEQLAPDVVLVTDGGGMKRAALRPILGAAKVMRFIVGVFAKEESVGARFDVAEVNGESAVVIRDRDRRLDGIAFLTVSSRGVEAIHLVRNPVKLGALQELPTPVE
ncbi:sigma-70 family RNA polymerase sigma factor [Calidifontibacter sp. DB0510]|uniref:Sigma-70 family RNA polymerase sigma factor n=1 Tax=Metallococcus carri TaxID=1656884 RepID=A0A967EHU8_9MICO|nr:RNA polymerase sigma factor SigJ [Metallococcus carri]NHN57138.1 sigma-70 family RNA polymerase sigma factor [Metallococcus carri]NOP38993.1 RNA polymerase sigma factor SigJ [Calidifontibacter sp. DB2511S]